MKKKQLKELVGSGVGIGVINQAKPEEETEEEPGDTGEEESGENEEPETEAPKTESIVRKRAPMKVKLSQLKEFVTKTVNETVSEITRSKSSLVDDFEVVGHDIWTDRDLMNNFTRILQKHGFGTDPTSKQKALAAFKQELAASAQVKMAKFKNMLDKLGG